MDLKWHAYLMYMFHFHPRPPKIFSIKRPPKGGCCNPSLDFLPALFPNVCYQCITMGLLFPLSGQKSTIRLLMTSLWRYNVSAPSKFWKYSQTLKIYAKNRQNSILAKNRRNMRFLLDFGRISKGMIILIHIPSHKHIFYQIFFL